jgi:hypothetical protein
LVTKLPRIPTWLWHSWWGAPVALVGLLLVGLSPSTGFVVGLVGALMLTAGLRMLGGAVQARRNGSGPAG